MPLYRFGECELDTATRTLQRARVRVRVEPKVLDLLIYLVEQRARFLTHQELLDALWPGVVVAPAALARAIKEARRCVGDDGQRQAVIATLHARGYRFVAQVSEAGGVASTASSPSSSLTRDGSTRPALGSEGVGPRASQRPGIAWLYPRFARAQPWPEHKPIVYGRGTDCDVMLAVQDASRRHAELRPDGPIHVLRDLGSINGSFINGERVQQAPLQLGDVVRMGNAVGLVIRCEADAIEPQELLHGLFGSGTLARTLRPLRHAARDTLPVVLEGETGVGKELAARAVHALDARTGPFRAVSCASAAKQTMALLFGENGQPGLFAQAAGGTLLIDHLADLALEHQAQLVQLLDRDVSDGGSDHEKASPVRIVVTTQVALEDAVKTGKLRPDLRARLDGVCVRFPPLRERIEDVPALFAHFLRLGNGGRAPEVSAGLIERLCLYDWPYNVRELEALARRLLLLHAHEPPLRSAHLPAAMLGDVELET